MKIVIGQISQETNGFYPVKTTLKDFEAHGIYHGDEVLARCENSGEIGGFIEAAKSEGREITIVPTIRARSTPGGKVERKAFDYMKDRLITRLERALPVDGVLLSLHGSMIVDGVGDSEGALLKAIRAQLGSTVPVAVTLDLHANITRAMIDLADLIVGY